MLDTAYAVQCATAADEVLKEAVNELVLAGVVPLLAYNFGSIADAQYPIQNPT